MPKEPPSDGSQGEWVSGGAGEEVNRQKPGPGAEHRDLYDNRREAETSGPHEGGRLSAKQAGNQAGALEACDAFDSGDEGAKKVSVSEGGARRASFFKDRDYSS